MDDELSCIALLLLRRRREREKRRRIWVHPINASREREGAFSVLFPRLLEDEEKFRGNLHFTDNLTMAADPRPEMLDNKSQLNLILIPLNLNLTPTQTLTLVHKM